MKLVHVRPITLSCMVGFENNLVQMIILTKQCVLNKNHVKRSMSQSVLKGRFLLLQVYGKFASLCSKLSVSTFYKVISKFQQKLQS